METQIVVFYFIVVVISVVSFVLAATLVNLGLRIQQRGHFEDVLHEQDAWEQKVLKENEKK